MENIVCKSCGGSVTRKGNYYICDFCRSKWMIDSGNDVHAVERTNAWEALRNNDFEKSAELFENIIGKDATNHEAFWGRALALNAITFVDDVHEGKKVPTCNNITENPFLKDKDVQKAISLAPEEIKVSYQAQAEQIEKIRMEWLNVASKEPPYDVFISYKDSDRERGIERTQDSEEAEKIYTELVEEGYKVFYSRRSLRDKVSERYEPYIYNAIKTAKVMIVFGRKPEYFTSTWIKNEWSRFRTRIEKGEKHKNSLVVVVNNMSPSDLPVALKSRQAMNMSDLTFLETLKKHIKRVIEESNKGVHLDKIEIKGGQIAKKAAKLEVNAVRTREIGAGATAQTDITELQTLSLADTYMKAGQWEDAAKLVDDVLFNNPSCAEALWKQILIGKRVADNTTLCLKINEITETDLQYVDKILNCAGQDMAMTLLDLFYDSCYRNMPDALYCQILKTILPYQYDNRGQKINDAFNWSVRNSQRRTFTILLTTLDSNDVETYIQYNYQFAKATKTNADKKECIDRILKVDEGNIEALKMLLYIQLQDNEQSKTVIKTFESILKYSKNNRAEINELLTWLGKNLNSLDDCDLVKQILRYSTDDISTRKDELITLAQTMIKLSYFEEAEYLSKLVLTFDALNPIVYWNLCLIKVRATSEANIKASNIPLKQVPEYTKYLTLVDEKRRQECLKIVKNQESTLNFKKKAKKVRIMSVITAAAVAIIVAVVMIFQNVIIPSNQYKDANNLVESGKYEEARDIYESLGDYKNASKHIAVLDNMEKIDNGDYKEAVKDILSLGVPVKVNYALDGGSFNSSLSRAVTVDEEERFTSASAFIDFKHPTKTGYNFAEWEHVSYGYVADGDFTLSLKAKWTTFDYTLTYNLDGGLAVNPEGYDIEDDTFMLINPTKKGYSFEGWTSEEISTPTKIVTIEKGSTGNREFTAHWSANTYTIFFDVNGGTLNPSPITTTFDSYYLLPVPEMEYYEFAGWYYNGSLYKNGLWLEDVDFTLTARWEPIAYNINYIMDGGLNSDNNPSHYTIESNPIVLADANRKGYNFLGWYRDNTFTKEILKIESNEHCNIDIYAKWEIITYSITYNNTFGLENKNQTTYTVEDEIELLDIISITNPFVSWHKNSISGELIEKIAKGTAEDLILFADFEYEFNPIYNKADLKGSCKDNTIITDNICILMNDIDLGNDEWISLGKFTGFLEGNGFCISNFKITDMDIQSPTTSGNYNLGLFSQIYGGVVNLSIKNYDININTEYGSLYVGGLSGVFDGTAYNCNVEGNIQAFVGSSLSADAGGLFGKTIATNETLIMNCTANCNITASTNVGGLVGTSNKTNYVNCSTSKSVSGNSCVGGLIGDILVGGTIDNCYSSVSISSGNKSGGLIGYIKTSNYSEEISIKNSYATGNVVGVVAGGLIGECYEYKGSTAVSNCYANGDIVASIAGGGLIGISDSDVLCCWATGAIQVGNETLSNDDGVLAGGLIGDGSAYQCFATGNVTAQNKGPVSAGGLLGFGFAENCYATGRTDVIYGRGFGVTDHTNAGGLIGRGSAKNCYSSGDVSATGDDIFVGGLIGWVERSIENCFAIGNIFATSAYGQYSWYEPEVTVGGVVAIGWYDMTINKAFYSSTQIINTKDPTGECILETNSAGIAKDPSEFTKKLFYKNILMWDETIWNIIDGELPTLKWELNR